MQPLLRYKLSPASFMPRRMPRIDYDPSWPWTLSAGHYSPNTIETSMYRIWRRIPETYGIQIYNNTHQGRILQRHMVGTYEPPDHVVQRIRQADQGYEDAFDAMIRSNTTQTTPQGWHATPKDAKAFEDATEKLDNAFKEFAYDYLHPALCRYERGEPIND